MIIDPSLITESTPTWICNQNYKQNNVCDGFTKDTGKAAADVGAPNDFYQCILTPNNECIPAVNKCKLPNRLDSSNEIVRGYTERTHGDADELHHICACNQDRSSCNPLGFDWTDPQFSVSTAKEQVTKPLFGVNGVISTGNRGGICDR